MIHSIYPGDLIEISPIEDDLKIGLIYIYESSGKLIIHRLVRINHPQDSLIITKGDNNILPDPPVTREQILGQVSLLRKSTRHYLFKIWASLQKALK